MSQRRYFVVRALTRSDEEGGGVTADCPPGWSGTPEIGRGCYVVMHPTWDPECPVLNETLSADALVGLDDEALWAQLPVEIKEGATDDEIQALSTALGFSPVSVSRLLKHKVGGV